MNMIVNTALLAGAAPAAAQTGAPDSELIALAKQIADLKVHSDRIDEEQNRCYEIYNRVRPEPSTKLRWLPGDPVGYSRSDCGWCNFDDIDRLRGKMPIKQWIFAGTAEEWEKLGLSEWNDNRIPPVVGHEHLFVSVGDEFRQKRCQELIEALDEYNAADEAAAAASGCLAAEKAAEAIYRRMNDLFNRMLKLPPSTLDGYRAMASAIVNHCWPIHIIDRSELFSDPKDRALAIMLSSLTGVATAA